MSNFIDSCTSRLARDDLFNQDRTEVALDEENAKIISCAYELSRNVNE